MIEIYVPSTMEQTVINAIEEDDWFGNYDTADTVAKALTRHTSNQYKVYKVTIEEI